MSAEMNNFNREIELLKKLKEARVLDQSRKEQLKQNILAQAANPEPLAALKTVSSTTVKKQRFFAVMRYALTTAAGISVVAGTAFASNRAKPGDTLFPVKKLKENIQISLTTNDQAKAALEAKIAQDRLNSLIEIKNKSENHKNQDQNQPIQNQTAQPNPAPVQNPGDNQTPNQNQNSSGSESNNNDSQNGKKPQLEQEAADELSQAVEHLRQTQAKLRQKGNTQAAAEIDNTILELQQKAQMNLGADQGDKKGSDDHKDGGKAKEDQNSSDQSSNDPAKASGSTGSGGSSTSSGTKKHRSSNSGSKDKIEIGPISPEPQIPPNTTIDPQPAPQQESGENAASPQANTDSSKIESGVLLSTPVPQSSQGSGSGSQNGSDSNNSGSDSGK